MSPLTQSVVMHRTRSVSMGLWTGCTLQLHNGWIDGTAAFSFGANVTFYHHHTRLTRLAKSESIRHRRLYSSKTASTLLLRMSSTWTLLPTQMHKCSGFRASTVILSSSVQRVKVIFCSSDLSTISFHGSSLPECSWQSVFAHTS